MIQKDKKSLKGSLIFVIGIIILVIVGIVVYIFYPRNYNQTLLIYDRPCNYSFFCDSTYLYALGKSKAFNDSKTIVDLVMKDDFDKFKDLFDAELFAEGTLENITKVRNVVYKYFDNPGKELMESDPADWQSDPFQNKIKDEDLYGFALELNKIWKQLNRQATKNSDKGHRSSFLHMPYESIVPGGRFREIYYWDSYWTIQGLLASNMSETVRKMIQNMLYSVDKYGFVPNGGRIYYTTRSQPPFLTLMLNDYFVHTNDDEFLKGSLPLLDKEYNFWLENREVKVNNHSLFQYRTKMAYERPESFWEDHETANKAERLANRSKEQVFIDLSSAAESGWDFSSRWLAYSGPHASRLYSIRTTKIVPVCLNSILCKVAGHLKDFHKTHGNTNKTIFYENEVRRLKEAIEEVLWDQLTMSWFDYDLEEMALHKRTYISNYYPLWAKCHDKSKNELSEIAINIENSGFIHFASGVSTSLVNSNQQWDFPNAWPPLQDIMIESLANCGEIGQNMSMGLIQKWISNNYYAYKATNSSFEKFHAVKYASYGGGGEYSVQIGFGWTNGVILKYLNKYGHNLTLQNECELNSMTLQN